MTQRDEINGMLEQCQAMDAPIPETLPPQSEIDGLTRPIRCAKAPTSLDPAHESAVAKKLAQIPPMYQSTYRRAMRGKSLKAAARAFCLECVGWQRREVDLCTAPACPLYPYRTRGRRTASERGKVAKLPSAPPPGITLNERLSALQDIRYAICDI